jgi:hypothetical protein
MTAAGAANTTANSVSKKTTGGTSVSKSTSSSDDEWIKATLDIGLMK